MKKRIMIWSDVDHCEWAAQKIDKQLSRAGLCTEVCYNQRALENFTTGGDRIALAIIVTDFDWQRGPKKVFKAIEETSSFDSTLPILLVTMRSDGHYLRIFGTVDISKKSLLTEIENAVGEDIRELVT